jgi:hypothetical protein
MNWKAPECTIYLHTGHGRKACRPIFIFAIQQKTVSESYSKQSASGGGFRNTAEGPDEDFMEEVILTDLFEVKAADYEDDQEQIKKQEANIFVPSSSPGNTLP